MWVVGECIQCVFVYVCFVDEQGIGCVQLCDYVCIVFGWCFVFW